jgi:hypothetical protein
VILGALNRKDGLVRTVLMISTQASHSRTERGPAWDEGIALLYSHCVTHANDHSLGWMELQTIMAKIIYRYDMEPVDDTVDWHRDSRMHTLWEKPSLMVKLKRHAE